MKVLQICESIEPCFHPRRALLTPRAQRFNDTAPNSTSLCVWPRFPICSPSAFSSDRRNSPALLITQNKRGATHVLFSRSAQQLLNAFSKIVVKRVAAGQRITVEVDGLAEYQVRRPRGGERGEKNAT
jgi:hypothetical protein